MGFPEPPDRRTGPRPRILAALALAALLLADPALRPARADIAGVVYNPANGHYYKWVFVGTVTWVAGKAGAEGLGGYLATITSSAEQAWIAANIMPAGQTACLGGTDETVENTWVWQTGEPWAYTNWNSGEPNNVSNEDYLAWTTNGSWNDVMGTTGGMSGYIIEWDVNPNIPPPPADPTNLAGVLGADNHVLLSWSDNSTNESSFDLERKSSASSFTHLASPAANTTSHDDGATFASSTYTYRLRAVNAGGNSAWSNEVVVSIPGTPSAPAAPSDLHSVASTSSSVTLAWTDHSDDESSFEIHRRDAAGVFQFVTSVGADVVQYAATGLAPDASHDVRVRAVNAYGASAFADATVETPPTLTVTTVRADLKDSPKVGKDSLKLQARFDFLPASDGDFDPVAEGITLRAGTGSGPVMIKLPPGIDGWKVAATKATWKSAKGSLPKYKIEVFPADRLVKVTVTGTNLSIPAANPMLVSVGIGDDAGTQHLDWPAKKPGTFQYR